MIKLVITSDSTPPMTRCFEYSPITIGGPRAKSADLQLEDSSLSDRHLQITCQKSDGKTVFFAHNLANDPFSTLNGLPFGKQPIGNNDLIQINDIVIRFEIDSTSEIRDISQATPAQPSQEKILRKETKVNSENSDHPREFDDPETITVKQAATPTYTNDKASQPERPFPQMKISESTLNTAFPYTQPSTPLVGLQKKVSFLSPQAPQSTGSAHPPKLSLKDYYLSEYDEENEHADMQRESNGKSFLSTQLSKRWRVLLILISALFVIVATTAGLAFLWVSDQSNEEEIDAARGVADVAMALTYAQLKNIQPQNQNWSHHEFLKNNLYAIMASTYFPLADFDSHGQFSNCPYMLRIHTNSDSSQFVVIAQPAPSILHWLIPKASIVLDSRNMEMRKIKDIKALNRLIVNANLEGDSGTEITHLVKQGSLITLASLAESEENLGFILPKALGMIRPGAENLVYNAPRYYLLGEALLESSLGIVERYAGAGEVHLLQQELNALMKYPDLVLYSSEGIENALEAQRALATIAPKDKFLIAYLQLTSKGKIASAQLLLDDTTTDLAAAEFHNDKEPSVHEDDKEHEPEHAVSEKENEEALDTPEANSNIDVNDPLFLHLNSMTNTRLQVLKPISDELTDLLKKESQAAQPDFTQRFVSLQKKFLNADKDQQIKLEKKFEAISNEYSHLPAASLMEFIKSAGLEVAFSDYLKMLKQQPATQQITDEKVTAQIKLIEKSETWPELENSVVQANQLLRFENIPGEERLIAFQNSARLIVTQKLNQFILSSDGSLSSNDFAPDYLQSLSNILKHAWIVDPETYDFYIDEFELREPQS